MGFFIGVYVLGIIVFSIAFFGMLMLKSSKTLVGVLALAILLAILWPITIWFTKKI